MYQRDENGLFCKEMFKLAGICFASAYGWKTSLGAVRRVIEAPADGHLYAR